MLDVVGLGCSRRIRQAKYIILQTANVGFANYDKSVDVPQAISGMAHYRAPSEGNFSWSKEQSGMTS